MMKDEEAMSKAASSVEVIGEWLKHPHVAQATRVLGEGPGRLESRRHQEDALWRQTTNGSFLVCDWLVLVLDRLSLAILQEDHLIYTIHSLKLILSIRFRPLIQLVQDLIFAFNGFSYTYTARALKSHMVSEPDITSRVQLLKKKRLEAMECYPVLKPLLSVPDGESLIGSRGGWRGVMNLKPKLLVQELITSGYKKDEAKMKPIESSQEVFLVHHPSELKEEDFAHCVEQWRVEKEVVMRHWCEVSLKLTCKLGPILNPSLRRGVYLHDPRELGGYSRRGSNLLRSMMKDEEAMSKAASSVQVIGEWLKHPHVAQATRMGQDLRRLSIKALGVFRSVQKYPNEGRASVRTGEGVVNDRLSLSCKGKAALTMYLAIFVNKVHGSLKGTNQEPALALTSSSELGSSFRIYITSLASSQIQTIEDVQPVLSLQKKVFEAMVVSPGRSSSLQSIKGVSQLCAKLKPFKKKAFILFLKLET
ncbi:hypothetical protein Bca101_100785 [Brassica carinata]